MNLKLPLVELTNTTKCSFDPTDSSILDLLSTNSHACDFEIPLKGFKSLLVVDLVYINFYNTRSWVSSKNIASRRLEKALGTETLYLQLEA